MRTATAIAYEDPVRYMTGVAQAQAVECALQTMHAHLDELLTLEDLASVACLSPSHFTRVFRRVVGIPPVEFLSALRFQTARRLLLSTPMSVTDVCFEVGYTSMGSFTSRFTQMVGLSPRLLRQRARAFEPPPSTLDEPAAAISSRIVLRNALLGRIIAPTSFQGTIYVGLFTSPIPQGAPYRCTRLGAPGMYLLHAVSDGVYYLRAAAFPLSSDLQTSLLPGENMLLGNNSGPLVIHHGKVSGDLDLVLHAPRLTDPPLVMGLPLL